MATAGLWFRFLDRFQEARFHRPPLTSKSWEHQQHRTQDVGLAWMLPSANCGSEKAKRISDHRKARRAVWFGCQIYRFS